LSHYKRTGELPQRTGDGNVPSIEDVVLDSDPALEQFLSSPQPPHFIDISKPPVVLTSTVPNDQKNQENITDIDESWYK